MNDGIVGVDSAIYNSSSMVNSNYGSKVIFDQLEPINRRRGRRGTIESLRSISRTLTRFRSSINSTANSTTVIQRLFSLLRQHSNHLNQINRSVGLIDSVSSKLSIYANSSSNGQQQQQRSTAAVNNENIGQQHHQRSSRPLSTYSIPSNSSYIRSTVNSSSNGQQASSSSRTLLLIESISREIGLECFLDSENSNLLMIGGRRMVIDIEIVDNGKEKGINSGAVVGTISGGEVGVGVGSSSSGSGSGSSAGVGRIKSKFSYSIDDDDDQKRDKYLDHQLEVLLSNVHQRMVRLLESSDDHNNNGQSDVKSDRRVEDLRLIQELSISLEAFSTCLRQLKFIDELIDNESTSEQKNQLQNSSNPSKVDYFWTYRDLINNYHSLTLRKIKNVDLLTKLPRTGLPLTSEDQFQLELVYHYNTSSILKNSIIDLISTKKRSGYNLMITLSSSSKDLETLEEEYDGLGELGTRGCFFAKFEPSLCVNRLTGYEIWKTSTRINLSKNLRLRSKKHSISDNWKNDARLDHGDEKLFGDLDDGLEDEIELEELLIDQIINQNDQKFQRSPSVEFSSFTKSDSFQHFRSRAFGVKFEGQPRQIYNYIKEREGSSSLFLNFHNSHRLQQQSKQKNSSCDVDSCPANLNDGLGYLIDSIRFDSLDALLKIIKVCQRQCILNELFNSCFNRLNYLKDDHQGRDESRGVLTLNQLLRQDSINLTKDQIMIDQISIDLIIIHSKYQILIQFNLKSKQINVILNVSEIDNRNSGESNNNEEDIEEDLTISCEINSSLATTASTKKDLLKVNLTDDFFQTEDHSDGGQPSEDCPDEDRSFSEKLEEVVKSEETKLEAERILNLTRSIPLLIRFLLKVISVIGDEKGLEETIEIDKDMMEVEVL